MLIEEFMLLANKTVAMHIGKPKSAKGAKSKPKTFVYRVHDVPNPDKLENFSTFIKRFGYKLKTTGKSEVVSAAINNLLDQVTGKREQNLIETLAIRSMAKATYTTENIGHYGLAFDYYTHFTSPIRRYPDMMVHRLLTRYLFEEGHSVNKNEYEEYCEHSSDMEQLAASAERAENPGKGEVISGSVAHPCGAGSPVNIKYAVFLLRSLISGKEYALCSRAITTECGGRISIRLVFFDSSVCPAVSGVNAVEVI
jgi:hypothetical protein